MFQTLEPPQYVFWYHNDKIISYDTSRTKVSFDSGAGGKVCSAGKKGQKRGKREGKEEEVKEEIGEGTEDTPF